MPSGSSAERSTPASIASTATPSGSRRDKRAIVWEGEPGDQKTLTYGELHAEVQKCANVLKRLGVGHGDRVAVYLPMIPELPIVMLACARIGAVHSVVFGGFSAESLRDRINDMQAKLLVTADGGFRRGGVVPLKEISDAALDGAPSVQNVLLVKREGLETPFKFVEGRDHWYHDLMAWVGETCPPRENDAEDLLFTLYTSGTTGKPKGIAHTTGGYLTGTYITTKWVFDLKEDDIYWCSADIGWVTGHSYLVYGPLANGATCVMYEGAPDTPGRDRFWDMIERHKVTVFYTAPTAIRAFMKWGPEHVSKHDLSTLRLIGSVGEPINPEAWMWYHHHVGGDRCPIVDTWWQTETGSILITPLPGLTKLKPGSASRPFPGLKPAIVTESGQPVEGGRRLPRADAPLAVDAAHHLRRSRPLRRHLLEPLGPCDLRHRRRRQGGRGRLLLAARPGRRRPERRRAPRRHHGGRERPGRPPGGRRGGGRRQGARDQGAGDLRVRHAEGGRRSLRTTRSRSSASTSPPRSVPSPSRTRFSGPSTCRRPAPGKIMRRLLRDIAAGKALGDVTTLADPSIVAKLREQYEEKEG